jgi:hypothetical protein
MTCQQIGFTCTHQRKSKRSPSLYVLGYIAVTTLATALTILISVQQAIT